MTPTWERQQWAALVAVLLVVIVLMYFAWPKPPAAITVRVVDGPKVLSTQVVPLR